MTLKFGSIVFESLTGGEENPVAFALADCRKAFWSVALFSGVVNLLMLAGPLYMLQVYDRVLASRSVATLVALTAFLVGAYLFQGLLDAVRARVIVRSAALLDHHLSGVVHSAVARLGVETRRAGEATQPLRDLDQIRSFLSGSGPTAIVDLPWTPLFLLICFLIHPWLGVAALIGGILLFAITLVTERMSCDPVQALSREGGLRGAMIEATRRNGETIAAMGMAPAMSHHWRRANQRYLKASQRAADVMSSSGSATKVIRLLLQSTMLAVGAYLVIYNELMAGAMIAASVMMGRALAPLETAIANWRGFVSARDSVQRLSVTLRKAVRPTIATKLPPPRGSLSVDSMVVVPAGADKPVVGGLHFELAAGEGLGVIGPSGSGKTSLARVLVGVWPPAKGSVRLDRAAIHQWDQADLGRYIGYMAQTTELFEGTVAENIARMSVAPDNAAVLRAARNAGAHEMIVKFPAGYDTRIGPDGSLLSAGQRQRIALARALYGEPFLIVLDEPNANLDAEGDAALTLALNGAKARGAIVIVVAHRPSALATCDKLLVIGNGIQQAFGPIDEVLSKLALPAPLQRVAVVPTPRRSEVASAGRR